MIAFRWYNGSPIIAYDSVSENSRVNNVEMNDIEYYVTWVQIEIQILFVQLRVL